MGNPLPWTPVAAGVAMAMGLVMQSVSTGKWSSYSRVWREWEEFLASLASDRGDQETCLLYFI